MVIFVPLSLTLHHADERLLQIAFVSKVTGFLNFHMLHPFKYRVDTYMPRLNFSKLKVHEKRTSLLRLCIGFLTIALANSPSIS